MPKVTGRDLAPTLRFAERLAAMQYDRAMVLRILQRISEDAENISLADERAAVDDRIELLLLRLDDFAAAQAGRADAHALGGRADFGVHGAQVDVPAPLGHVVGVADVISKLRPFAADRANLCHDCSG